MTIYEDTELFHFSFDDILIISQSILAIFET